MSKTGGKLTGIKRAREIQGNGQPSRHLLQGRVNQETIVQVTKVALTGVVNMGGIKQNQKLNPNGVEPRVA